MHADAAASWQQQEMDSIIMQFMCGSVDWDMAVLSNNTSRPKISFACTLMN
jgi:hypothetical protein